MSQISFQNMRVKTCPFHKGYQQIFSYAYLVNEKLASESSEPGKDKSKIHLVLAHGTEPAIKTLDQKLVFSSGTDKASFWQKSLPELGLPTKLYWPKTDHCRHFHEICEKFGSCHTAYELMDEEIKIRTKATEPTPYAFTDDAFKDELFTMNVCIQDYPGTLYALYCIDSQPFSDVETSGPISFDFNIDYIRSTNCRVKRNVKIDFYGNFLKKAYTEEFQNILSNIELMVIFYPTSKVETHFDRLNDALMKHLNKLVSKRVDIEKYLVYSRYSDPGNEFTSQEFSWKMRCPVARVAGCPAERKRLSTDSRKPPLPSKWNDENKTVKIETCISNEVGALRDVCDWICKDRTIHAK